MRADERLREWIRAYYTALDERRYDDAMAQFTADASIHVAHNPPVRGRDAIARAMRAGIERVGSIRHELGEAWEEEGGLLIFEVVAHYELADGRRVAVPGIVVARVRDGKFAEQRVYADLSPVTPRR